MPIQIVCPGCHKRFQVSEQFAGKSGPCPKCKTVIKIPAKEEEVQVHGGEAYESGGRGQDGKLLLKPITREETKVTPLRMGLILGSIGLVALLAYLGRSVFTTNWLALAAGTLVVSPAIALAGYALLRDQDLEPHRGKSVLIRSLICGAAYAALWGVFGYSSEYLITGEIFSWIVAAVPFVVAGALIALGCFDLDFTNGCFHYSFYLLVTIVLRFLAGNGWIWNLFKE